MDGKLVGVSPSPLVPCKNKFNSTIIMDILMILVIGDIVPYDTLLFICVIDFLVCWNEQQPSSLKVDCIM